MKTNEVCLDVASDDQKRFMLMQQNDAEQEEHEEDDTNDNNHVAESPVKDTTLEPESDDELFINEGPSLNDDDDSDQEEAYPRETFDDSSNFVDEDTTYGSPGLREAFNEGYAGVNHDTVSRAGSADAAGRKNKRKQFKPRNIVYSMNEEEEKQERESRESRNSVTSDRDNSPMDLSTVRTQQQSDSDSEDCSRATNNPDQSKPKLGGLSVVRPEILFGDNKDKPSDDNNTLNTQLNPLSLLSNLSVFPPGLNLLNNLKSVEEAGQVKDEFKEMLKLFGVAPEVAENLIPNMTAGAEQRKGECILIESRKSELACQSWVRRSAPVVLVHGGPGLQGSILTQQTKQKWFNRYLQVFEINTYITVHLVDVMKFKN